MAGFRLPRQSNTYIDLQPYGGEGKLSIHPIKVGDSLRFKEEIKAKAKKDGYDASTDAKIEELAKTVYSMDTLANTLLACVYAVEDDGERQLTMDEVFDLPMELLQEIIEIINKGTNFPLAQNAGKGQK